MSHLLPILMTFIEGIFSMRRLSHTGVNKTREIAAATTATNILKSWLMWTDSHIARAVKKAKTCADCLHARTNTSISFTIQTKIRSHPNVINPINFYHTIANHWELIWNFMFESSSLYAWSRKEKSETNASSRLIKWNNLYICTNPIVITIVVHVQTH